MYDLIQYDWSKHDLIQCDWSKHDLIQCDWLKHDLIQCDWLKHDLIQYDWHKNPTFRSSKHKTLFLSRILIYPSIMLDYLPKITVNIPTFAKQNLLGPNNIILVLNAYKITPNKLCTNTHISTYTKTIKTCW